MVFEEAPLAGVFIIDVEPAVDPRGLFARTYCAHEFTDHGLATTWVQCNTAFNARAGTLRGLHFQRDPHAEIKLVRCTSGALFDVAVDIRPRSPTFGRWFGVELSAENRRQLYIPAGFAHGYQTLTDHTELFYQVSTFYHPQSEDGLRWDDPALDIAWPLPDPIVSDKDRQLPGFEKRQPANSAR